ncbi:MAG TPA: RsmD family RNA methyltransferase [Thermomicrobiales bacterium]|jgi:16S rRNA (guanine966-N2)-methyltransferase|nr:RsmD family RNA methyltransferase [Thermomicrobiales bacterium]
MRVIAGEVGGFRLRGPADRGTRPMTDKIKSALFSMLASLGAEPDRVLDLYAGTGGLGIEALSRGALQAEFVEQAPKAMAVVRANIEHCRYTDVTVTHQTSVAAFIARGAIGSEPFDLVFMDPPYADEDIVERLVQLGESTLLQSGALVVLGHWPRLTPPERAGRLSLLRSRCHGDSCFTVYERTDDVSDTASPPTPAPISPDDLTQERHR